MSKAERYQVEVYTRRFEPEVFQEIRKSVKFTHALMAGDSSKNNKATKSDAYFLSISNTQKILNIFLSDRIGLHAVKKGVNLINQRTKDFADIQKQLGTAVVGTFGTVTCERKTIHNTFPVKISIDDYQGDIERESTMMQSAVFGQPLRAVKDLSIPLYYAQTLEDADNFKNCFIENINFAERPVSLVDPGTTTTNLTIRNKN